jgi:hypothetical protein
MNDTVWQLIIGSIILAIIFTLVRPGAPAAAAITDVTNALSGLIGTTTDYQVTAKDPQAT